ncbi:MAG TPA: DnaJ C-terminal domain-containing protein, partial [Candidatus Paceibacterota bacterium]
KGAGIVRSVDEIRTNIPAGVTTGEVMKVAGRGEAIRGGPAGDLYIRLHVKTPTKFSKKALEVLEELRKEGL